MIKIGDYNMMEVSRFTASGAYLVLGDVEALLPNKFVTPNLKEGDKIEVFLFTDSEDRLTATTQKPKAKAGEFAYLKVVDTNRFGAFMDWGLDKDLLVPFSEQRDKMEQGHKYIVRIVLDFKSNRLIGVSKIRDFFKTDVSKIEVGQKVDLMVFGEIDIAIKVIIDHQYEGLLYKNEVFAPLNMGEKSTGYIKKIREDGKLDVTIYKAGMEGVKEAENMILNRLKLAQGFLPYNDSTPPDTIKEELMMSKKMFKKAIGGLYKNGIITFKDGGFVLNEKPVPPLAAKTPPDVQPNKPKRERITTKVSDRFIQKEVEKPKTKSLMERIRIKNVEEDKPEEIQENNPNDEDSTNEQPKRSLESRIKKRDED